MDMVTEWTLIPKSGWCAFPAAHMLYAERPEVEGF